MLNRNFRWYSTKLLGPDGKSKLYRFRPMCQSEEYAWRTKQNEYASEEYVLTNCVLEYEGDVEYTGTTKTLVDLVIKASGVGDHENTLLDNAVQWMSDPYTVNEAVACAMMSGITPTYLRTCDPQDRMSCIILGRALWSVYEQTTGVTLEEVFQVRTERQPGNDIVIGS